MKSALGGLAARLQPAARGAKWVPPGQIHLTLKFFEELSREEIPRVGAAVATACLESPPFEITVKGAGAFGHPGAVRVIWAGISNGGDSLAALARSVELRLEEAGIPRESRPFTPHVTLCRFRGPCRAPALAAAIQSLKDFECGTFQANELALFSSELRPSGAVHTLLTKCPMGTV